MKHEINNELEKQEEEMKALLGDFINYAEQIEEIDDFNRVKINKIARNLSGSELEGKFKVIIES